MKQSLILVLGLPDSGKTTLSNKLADELQLPLISRDAIKLLIMDDLGWADREWSKKVGKASYGVLDYVIREQLKSGTSFIVESDFRPEIANEKFMQLQDEFGCNAVQVICHADEDTLVRRWQARAASEMSHPSSTEGAEGLRDLRDAIKLGPRKPLALKGSVIRVDTNDVVTIDESAVVRQIRQLL